MFAHDPFKLDYCVDAALNSALAVADEVVFAECGSSDGTRAWLEHRASKEPKLRIVEAGWKPVPDATGNWMGAIADVARLALRSRFNFGLQADEVLHEDDYGLLRAAAELGHPIYCPRLNFWRDPQHLAPNGRVCGSNILRGAERNAPFVGDAENIAAPNPKQSRVRIFHYGFLRSTPAVIEKSIKMEEAIFGTHNQLFERMKTEGRKPFDEHFSDDELQPYAGTHPAAARQWLEQRGYRV